MNKAVLRKIFLAKRRALTPLERQQKEAQILDLLPPLLLPQYPFLLSYKPILDQNEISLLDIEQHILCLYPHTTLCYPVTAPNFSCTLYATNVGTIFQKSALGIMEPINAPPVLPTQIDAVFTPLLCFDRRGYRVGYGKGVYDQLFAQMKPNVLKIGFSYFDAVDRITDVHPLDIALDMIITPTQVYYFKQ